MRKNILITAGASLAAAGVIVVAATGLVSAASNPNVGSSTIPRTVFKQERLDAESQVLNTSTSSIQTAHKDKTMKTLITNAGLTKKTYAEKLKTQLTTDLEAKGYSSDQVTIALQHKTIHRLRHEKKAS